MARRPLTGVLLVGGASTRFGSPKALALARWGDGDETLAERAWRVLGEACEERIAVGKAGELELPFPVLDDASEVRAPIAGVVAGLRAAAHDVCVFLPVDCPLVDVATLRALGEACLEAAVPQTGPLPGAYAQRALPVLEERLARGELALKRALSQLDTVTLELDANVLANANTPAELALLDPRVERFAAAIGAALFARAAAWAWETAAGTGTGGLQRADAEAARRPEGVLDVSFDLIDVLEEDGPPDVDDLFALYRALPSYALLMYASDYLRRMDARDRARFWSAVRTLVGSADDRLADPLLYWLSCGPFEDAAQAAQAWDELTEPGALSARGLERILHASGPVPWTVKEPVLRRLAADERWHAGILDSLEGSTFDHFGSVDRARALKLLARLKVGRRSARVSSLRTELEQRGGPRSRG